MSQNKNRSLEQLLRIAKRREMYADLCIGEIIEPCSLKEFLRLLKSKDIKPIFINKYDINLFGEGKSGYESRALCKETGYLNFIYDSKRPSRQLMSYESTKKA